MNFLKTGGLAAVCAGAAMLITAPIASAGNAGVNIIYPPKQVSDFDQPDASESKTQKIVVKVKVRFRRDFRREYFERRQARADRALFQNYTGFRKQYTGRKFPF